MHRVTSGSSQASGISHGQPNNESRTESIELLFTGNKGILAVGY